MRAKHQTEADITPLDHLRESAAIRVQSTSLRSVAREIGMSPTSLRNFLQGTEPYGPTVHRLRTWYIRYAAVSTGQVKLEDASAALGLLVRDLAPDARRRMATRLINTMAREYSETGKIAPVWLSELRARYENVDVSEPPAPRPSAMGKYAHLKWSSEDYARRKQEDIDLEDGRAA
jgi:hypothetical protein